MAGIHITDIEAAINFWRERKPSPDGVTLAPELRAFAEVYALLIFYHEDEAEEAGASAPKAYAAWTAWFDTQPDTPCIAICSTSQGDEECKGCGRSFEEVQRWTEMSPAEKRQVWRRITLEGGAWRSTATLQARRRGRDRTAHAGDQGLSLMRRVAQAPNIAIATLWADTLCGAGIDATVQRQFLSGAAGELPPDQCLPEVWVLDDEQEGAARVPARALRTCRSGASSFCACGELVEGASSRAGTAAGPCLDAGAAVRLRLPHGLQGCRASRRPW